MENSKQEIDQMIEKKTDRLHRGLPAMGRTRARGLLLNHEPRSGVLALRVYPYHPMSEIESTTFLRELRKTGQVLIDPLTIESNGATGTLWAVTVSEVAQTKPDLTIRVTPRFLMDSNAWKSYCIETGMREFAVADGLCDEFETLEVTLRQASKWGLLREDGDD